MAEPMREEGRTTTSNSFLPVKKLVASFWFIGVVSVLLSCILFLPNIDSYPMQNWDEGVHSQVTKEMVETGDYWSLHYQGEMYFRKPPLKIWMTAPMVSMFGDYNWVYRFWSALAGVATVLVLARFVHEKQKNAAVTWLTVGIFVTGQFIFYHAFLTAEMDALLVFFTTLGVYAYWKRSNSLWWLLLAGGSFGLAIMSKSLAGMIGPFIVLIDLLIRKDWQLIRSKFFWSSLAVFCAVTLPWHISQIALWGANFWNDYIGFHVVERTFEQLYADLPALWYADITYQRLFPFSLFIGGALLLIARDILRDKNHSLRLVLVWALVPFVLFTWIKTKFEWYLLPMYPAIAWMIAYYLHQLMSKYKDWLLQVTGFVSAILVLGLLPGAVIPGSKTFWLTLQAYIPDGILDRIQNRFILSGLVVTIIVWLMIQAGKKYKKVIPIMLVLFILHSFAFTLGRNAGMMTTLPEQSVYEDIRDSLAQYGGTTIVLLDNDLYGRPAAYFELRRVSDVITNEKDSSKLEQYRDSSEILITESSSDVLEERPVLYHGEQYIVYAPAR